MYESGIIRFLLTGLLALGTGACGLAVNSLSEPVASPPPMAELPPSTTLRVERFRYAEAESMRYPLALENGLAEALRDTRLFSAVYSPSSTEPEADTADLLLRGELLSEWGSQGAANFFTYFPGGLIFAPSWRGVRWNFKSIMDLEIVDTTSEEVVGRYIVESEHQLVHRSGNPMHFLFAATIVPATIIGSGKTWVRASYRERVYDTAYPEFWRRVVARIAADRGPVALAALDERRERCGPLYGAEPVVGNLWDAFRDCQPDYYRSIGERPTSSGTAMVFEGVTARRTVFVIDGRISQWDGG